MMDQQALRKLEERLRRAMLASDCAELDALLSVELIFTNHLGQTMNKQDDLYLHRSGTLKFTGLEPTEFWAREDAGIAIVSVRMKAEGSFADAPFHADLRFTRVWRQEDNDTWRIIAGHSCTVQTWMLND